MTLFANMHSTTDNLTLFFIIHFLVQEKSVFDNRLSYFQSTPVVKPIPQRPVSPPLSSATFKNLRSLSYNISNFVSYVTGAQGKWQKEDALMLLESSVL